jgi:proliferating cell nuclear antigen
MTEDVYVIDAKKLKKFFETIGQFACEVKLQTFDEGSTFYASVTDIANAVLCRVTISPDHFEKDCEVNREIGLDVHEVLQAISCFKSRYAQPISLSIDQIDPELKKMPQYRISGWKFGIPDISPHLSLSHSIIDPAVIRKEPKIPEIEFKLDFKMPALVLHDVAKILRATNADQVAVIADETHLTFSTDVKKNCCQKMTYSIDRKALMDESNHEAKSLFSVDYFTDIVKVMPKDCLVRMRFDENYPVRFDFEPFGKGFEAMVTLAPRIET